MNERVMDGGASRDAGRPGLKDLIETYERSLILDALTACGGHQRRTAARLGILPTTLHEKMKRLGLLKGRAAERAELGLVGSREISYSSMSAQGRD